MFNYSLFLPKQQLHDLSPKMRVSRNQNVNLMNSYSIGTKKQKENLCEFIMNPGQCHDSRQFCLTLSPIRVSAMNLIEQQALSRLFAGAIKNIACSSNMNININTGKKDRSIDSHVKVSWRITPDSEVS